VRFRHSDNKDEPVGLFVGALLMAFSNFNAKFNKTNNKVQRNDNEFVQTELKAGRKLAPTGAQPLQLLFSCRQLACCL